VHAKSGNRENGDAGREKEVQNTLTFRDFGCSSVKGAVFHRTEANSKIDIWNRWLPRGRTEKNVGKRGLRR